MSEVKSCHQLPLETTVNYLNRFQRKYQLASATVRAVEGNKLALEITLKHLNDVAIHTLFYGLTSERLRTRLLNLRDKGLCHMNREAMRITLNQTT